ncbi:hypothetical protein H10PHJ05_4 [Aeromonas phage HJ05]|nr:hypothetical protein H10PHJ05_4 [Aeromonas phage HJ05]
MTDEHTPQKPVRGRNRDRSQVVRTNRPSPLSPANKPKRRKTAAGKLHRIVPEQAAHLFAGSDIRDMPIFQPKDAVTNEVERVRVGQAPALDSAFPEPPAEVEEMDESDVERLAKVRAAIAKNTRGVAGAGNPENLYEMMDDASLEQHPFDNLPDTGYQLEYKLKLMHRMLLRGLPFTAIAQALQVSPRQANALRKQLYARLRHEATRMDMPLHVGNSIAFFNEVKQQALQMATKNDIDPKARVGALNVALEAHKDNIRFLQLIGAYDAHPIKWAHDGDAAVEKANALQELAEMFLSGDQLDEGATLMGADNVEEADDYRLLEGYM